MHKYRHLLFFLILTLSHYSYSAEYDKTWGIDQNEFIKELPSGSDYTIFTPGEQPDYRNMIISFFSSMGEGSLDVKIVRIKGIPEKDYCFFNNRLYSVSENWGLITPKNADNLLASFVSRYLKPEIEKKDVLTIFTFTKERTKILVYKKIIDRNNIELKVFYYSNDIFNILLKD